MAKPINTVKSDIVEIEDMSGTDLRQDSENMSGVAIPNSVESVPESIILQETTEHSPEQPRSGRYSSNIILETNSDIPKFVTETNQTRLPPEMTCLICRDRPRDVVFMRCGHLLFCECCQRFYTTCPICHQTIKAFITVNWDILKA